MIVVTYEILRFLWRLDERWEWRKYEDDGWWVYGFMADPDITRGERDAFRPVYYVTEDLLRNVHQDIQPIRYILEELYVLR